MGTVFPGMDPYLERHWGDVRPNLVTLTRAELNGRLPDDLAARVGRGAPDGMGPSGEETYVTIGNADGGQLVTVIEFLGSSRKLPGQNRDQYRRRREELIGAKVNLVEIDPIRQGNWRDLLLPMIAPERVETAYRIVTRPRSEPRKVELYPIALRARLPVIRIPLRVKDPLIVLDLQAILDQAYSDGRYDRMSYRRPCDPPVEGDDAAWVRELLKSAGRE